MEEYWDKRFIQDGKIWSDAPSKTALYARDLFLENEIKTVLVPGAGYGRNAALFASAGFKVDGIEASGEALKLADSTADIKYYHGSVLDMPFSDDVYDAIYCFNVLHLFRADEREVFVKKCAGQLADNALAFFTVFSEKEPSFGKGKEVEPDTFESKPGRPVHYFTDDDLTRHFKGFKIIETGLIEDPEDHGEEGAHIHIVRYIVAQKKAAFEFDGEKYKASSRHQKEWGNKMIAGLELAGDESILDLGCGDGVLTAQLAELVPKGRVLGVDASEGMVATAGKLKGDNLSFRLMDINAMNFSEEFDLVFSNATLHWVKDHALLLKNVYESLKTGGTIRFNFAADGNCSAFESIAKAIIKEAHYCSYFSGFEWPWFTPGLAEYKRLAEESEFRDIDIWGENADRYFADTNELIGWLDQPSLVPFMRRIDDRDKASFRDIFIDRMIERTLESDGRCFETFRRINVFARK